MQPISSTPLSFTPLKGSPKTFNLTVENVESYFNPYDRNDIDIILHCSDGWQIDCPLSRLYHDFKKGDSITVTLDPGCADVASVFVNHEKSYYYALKTGRSCLALVSFMVPFLSHLKG